MKPNEILLKGCEEIARHFPDFKATQKGRLLKKKSQDKNIEFEIYFDTSARNYSGSVSIIPTVSMYYGKERKLIEGKNIGYFTPHQTYKEWNLAGLSFEPSVKSIVEQLSLHILPIFNLFEETIQAIDFLINKGTKYNAYIKEESLMPFYFVFDFGGKEKAEIFLNNFVRNCPYKGRFYDAYKTLKTVPKEYIDVNRSSFVGEAILKFAFLNDVHLNNG